MKKNNISQKVNLFFSAFLIFAYVICTYFIETFLSTIVDSSTKMLAQLFVFVLFGLFLFYATRVGDGKPVCRFSISSLILVVLPAIYVVAATYFKTLPLHEVLVTEAGSNMVRLASVALGYGIPFTFLSGFELKDDTDVDEDADEDIEDTEDIENTEDVEDLVLDADSEPDVAMNKEFDEPSEEIDDAE